MEIIVCVKQVPNLLDMSRDMFSTEQFLRLNRELINNPADMTALSLALLIKNKLNCKITTISMGPENAYPLVQQLFSYGVDRAILLSSPCFAGSDTYATSYVLQLLINKVCSDFKLILTGDKSLDGETGQVPHSLAVELDIPSFSDVFDIHIDDGNHFQIFYNVGSVSAIADINSPFLAAVSHRPYSDALYPRISDILSSRTKKVEIWTHEHLLVDPDKVGYNGSNTKVIQSILQLDKHTRNNRMIYFKDDKDMLEQVIDGIIRGSI